MKKIILSSTQTLVFLVFESMDRGAYTIGFPWFSNHQTQTELYQIFFFCCSPTCKGQLVEFLNLCNHVRHSYNTSPVMYAFILLVLFLWRTLTRTLINSCNIKLSVVRRVKNNKYYDKVLKELIINLVAPKRQEIISM